MTILKRERQGSQTTAGHALNVRASAWTVEKEDGKNAAKCSSARRDEPSQQMHNPYLTDRLTMLILSLV